MKKTINSDTDDAKIPLLLQSDKSRDPLAEEQQHRKKDRPDSSTNDVTVVGKELLSAWKRLKIPMALIFVIFLISLGLLVAGCIVYATASSHAENLLDSLNADITEFPMGGCGQLKNSTFAYEIYNTTMANMDLTTDPFYYKVQAVRFAGPYESAVYTSQLTLSQLSYSQELNDNLQTLMAPILFSTELNGVPSEITLNVVVWYVSYETLSSLQFSIDQCAKQGGYPDTTISKCVKFYAINNACTKVSVDGSGQWALDDTYGGSGCYYPFAALGAYLQVSYIGNNTKASYFAKNADSFVYLFVRAADDPYIELEKLTGGLLSIADINAKMQSNGSHLMLIGGIIGFISLVIGAVLLFVRRAIKRNFRISLSKSTPEKYSSFYSRPPVFRYIAITIALMGISVGVGMPLLDHWSYATYWIWSPFVGLLLIVWCTPIAIGSFIVFLGNVIKTRWRNELKYGLSIASSLVTLVAGGICAWKMIRPGQYNWGTFPDMVDPLLVMFGVMFCMVMVPFSFLNLFVCARALSCLPGKHDDISLLRSDDGETSKRTASNMLRYRMTSTGCILIIAGIATFCTAVIASAFMPPIWNVAFVGSYNTMDSPYSLCHIPAHYFIAIPKLYLDVVVFYSFIAFLVVVFALTSIVKPIYHFFNFWLRLKIKNFEVNTSVGEILLLTIFTGLTVWWIWFWMFGYARIATITDNYERVARGLGHCTNLFSSLLLFPVTRNSMWTQLMGIPFERAVKYHRWLGILVIASVSSHMLTFWLSWAFVYNALLHNIFSLQNVPHADNWSPPLMMLTWLGLLVMGLFSFPWFRRRRFELFYYTHHFFIIFFVTGLIHSWSLWYFLSGGLILWFVDRLIRFWRGTKAFAVISLANLNKSETTEVLLQQNGFKYRAGQYAFINVPTISPLEWHPFTISSSPGDDTVSFHIKNMGKSSWTARLNKLCEGSNSDEGLLIHTSRVPVINIDGPYGAPPKFDAPSVVLVAGGIGITPVLSIFKDFYHLHKTGGSTPVQHVTLLWVVRDSGTLEMFRDTFYNISTDNTASQKFEIILYVTGSVYYVEDVKDDGLPTRKLLLRPVPLNGRPNVRKQLSSIVAKHKGMRTMVMACGPPPLVKEARASSFHLGLDFHEETFEL